MAVDDLLNHLRELDQRLAEIDDPLEFANIYYKAALLYAQSGSIDEACFFMTQAFVFAIQQGEKTIGENARIFLKRYNRI